MSERDYKQDAQWQYCERKAKYLKALEAVYEAGKRFRRALSQFWHGDCSRDEVSHRRDELFAALAAVDALKGGTGDAEG